MKKTASLIFILALPVSLTAQVDIAGESVKRVKHSVEVAFDIHTTPKTLKNRYKMVLTPYLCNGADTVWLPQAEIYGKIRYKRERQEQALSGNRTWSLAPNQILEGGSCTYAAAVPYEKWMRTASLGIKRRMVGCACDCHDGDQTVPLSVSLKYKYLPGRSYGILLKLYLVIRKFPGSRSNTKPPAVLEIIPLKPPFPR